MLNGWRDGRRPAHNERTSPSGQRIEGRPGLGRAADAEVVEQGPVRYPNYGRVQDTAKPSMMHDIIAGSRSEMYG